METLQVLYKTWIFMSMVTICCSSLPATIVTNTSVEPSELRSFVSNAVLGNTRLFDVSGTLKEESSIHQSLGVPLLKKAQSTWRVEDNNSTHDKEHVPNSVPLPSTSLDMLDSSQGQNVSLENTTNLENINTHNNISKSLMLIHKNLTENSTKFKIETSSEIFNTSTSSDDKNTGVYIPLEKLARLRRQADVSESSRFQNQSRVLLLLNPKRAKNISAVQEKLDGKVLMLVKKPNASQTPVNKSTVINIESRNLHDLLHTGPISSRLENSLREAQQSLPAIQMIKNLDSINLSNTSSKDQTNNFSQNSNNQVNNDPSLSSDQGAPTLTLASLLGNPINNSVRSIIIQANSHPQSRISTIRINNGNSVELQPSRTISINPTNRQHASSNNVKHIRVSQPNRVIRQQQQQQQQSLQRQTRPIQRQLTLQPPVSSNRIRPAVRQNRISSSRSSVTGSRVNRPLVRTVSSGSLNPRRQPTRRITPRIVQRQSRGNIQQRRRPTRRQFIRRRPSRPDPFTTRFSAGFQRGSNLLHQPPIELTSFDGSSNVGFNTLSPAQIGLPPIRPPRPGPGPFGLPGLFPGPLII